VVSSDEHLANKFNDFFMRKITTIRDNIDNHKSPISDAVVISADIKFEGQPLTEIRPLLKKPNLDKEELKNYRKVSNLPFLSKILEKLVAKRLETHLSSLRLHDNLQSAYHTGHSTETALLKIHHDIAQDLDRKCMAALVLLD
jgi:hypothetical protein